MLRASNDVSSKLSQTRLLFLAIFGVAFEMGQALSTRYDVFGFGNVNIDGSGS